MAIVIGSGISLGRGIGITSPPPPPTFYMFTPYQSGLVKTTNLGSTWTNSGASAPVYPPYGVQIFRDENGVILGTGFNYSSPQGHFIFRSTDGGATLNTITLTDKLSAPPFSLRRVGNTWISSTGTANGNYYSTDNGATWLTSRNSYKISERVAAGNNSFLAVDLNVDQLIKSTDGINWSVVGTAPSFVLPDTRPFTTFDGTRWVAISYAGEVAYTPNETTFTWTTSSNSIALKAIPSFPPGWVSAGSTISVSQSDVTHLSNGTVVLITQYSGYTADFSVFIQGSAVFAGTASGPWTGTFFIDKGVSSPIFSKNDYMMLGFLDANTSLPLAPKVSTDGITWTDVTNSGYTNTI